MAGDWIKMRCNLDADPRVIAMACELGTSELHVVGCLWKVWSWADQHSIDGNALCVTDVTLDRFTCVTGFADSLRNAGWLDGENGNLCLPNFTEHNGETAKKRAETNKRVAKHRNAKRVTNVTQNALPEKRREEKRRVKNIPTTVAGDLDDNKPESKEPADDPAGRGLQEPLATMWRQWMEVWAYRHGNGRPMPETQQEAAIMELGRRGADAEEDLRVSIVAGSKNLIRHRNTAYNARTGCYVDPEKVGGKQTAEDKAAELKRQLGIGD